MLLSPKAAAILSFLAAQGTASPVSPSNVSPCNPAYSYPNAIVCDPTAHTLVYPSTTSTQKNAYAWSSTHDHLNRAGSASGGGASALLAPTLSPAPTGAKRAALIPQDPHKTLEWARRKRYVPAPVDPPIPNNPKNGPAPGVAARDGNTAPEVDAVDASSGRGPY